MVVMDGNKQQQQQQILMDPAGGGHATQHMSVVGSSVPMGVPGDPRTTSGGVHSGHLHNASHHGPPTTLHHGDNNLTTPLNINTNTVGMGMTMSMAGMGNHKSQRDYYPSPTSTETESSDNAIVAIQTRRIPGVGGDHSHVMDYANGGMGESQENYPEYKH